MAGITLAQAEAQLAVWLAADAAVANNQSYRINERQFTKADAEQIRENIKFWDGEVRRLDAAAAAGASGGRRVRHVVMG